MSKFKRFQKPEAIEIRFEPLSKLLDLRDLGVNASKPLLSIIIPNSIIERLKLQPGDALTRDSYNEDKVIIKIQRAKRP